MVFPFMFILRIIVVVFLLFFLLVWRRSPPIPSSIISYSKEDLASPCIQLMFIHLAFIYSTRFVYHSIVVLLLFQ